MCGMSVRVAGAFRGLFVAGLPLLVSQRATSGSEHISIWLTDIATGK